MRSSDQLAVPPWQPWAALALFAFLLHFVWELLQVPFYRRIDDAPRWEATLTCLRATAGDVVITLGAYGVVAMRAGSDWVGHQTTARLVSFVAVGLLATGVIELLSVHVLERWAYGPGVPVVPGVGLPPLLQWLLLPPLIVWLTRRHLGWNPRQAA